MKQHPNKEYVSKEVYNTLLDQFKENKILITKLQQQVEQLLRILYGKKSERKPKKDNNDETIKNKAANSAKNDINNENKARRKKLPETLPREKIKYELPDSELTCPDCKNKRHIIGKDVSEQLEFIPARLFVKHHVRYKYSCKLGCGVKTAPMPTKPIDKGIAGAGLLADILISKYQDAMPLYRQSLRFKRHHVEIAESSMCDWVAECAFMLSPIVDEIKLDLLKQDKLHTDDTPQPVLSKTKTRQARLWVYVSDKRNRIAATVYDYTASRSQTAPEKFLLGFTGYLQADAYPGYNILYKTGKIIEIGCLAHVRRKFYDVSQAAKGNNTADEAIYLIAKIYYIENKIRNYNNIERYYYRKRYLKQHYYKLKRWLKNKQQIVIPGVPLHKAINYALNHWRALQNVFANGALEVDNNVAERAIRPTVIGRKNYLFVGSHEGGKRAAIIYSIIETCKQNGVNTFEYLRDVLERLPSLQANKIRELLPYNWKPA